MSLRALEFFCGIGGFTAATQALPIEGVGAYDASQHVIEIFEHNWAEPCKQRNILQMGPDELIELDADLWWMSPPCQPYTTRGLQRDLEDRRAKSFVHMLELFDAVRPPSLAMENVEGFLKSEARTALFTLLRDHDYAFREAVICPTELGIPNRRPRYYLIASRHELGEVDLTPLPHRPVRDFLDESPDPDLWVGEADVAEYGHGFDIVDPDDDDAVTACFTSAYGKSWIYSGSYLKTERGVRRFSPLEIARLMQFPPHFSLPDDLDRRKAYKYIGNSLAIDVVRRLAGAFIGPEATLS